MYAIINQNGALWGFDTYPTKDAAVKDIRSLGSAIDKFEVVEIAPWQRRLIDGVVSRDAEISRLRATEPCPPAEQRIVTRYIDGMDRLARALRAIEAGANDPAAVARAALAAEGAGLLPVAA